MTLMAGAAGVVYTAAAALVILVLAALLFFIAVESVSKSLSARGSKGKRPAGKKRGKKRGKRGKKRDKKRGRGLLDCRHCHKRYTGPRHVCRLSWKQIQKVRKA